MSSGNQVQVLDALRQFLRTIGSIVALIEQARN